MSRRSLMVGVGMTLSTALTARALAETSPSAPAGSPTYRLEAETLVDAGRLNAEVAAAFPLFNAGQVVRDFNLETQGARNNVVLRRIVTTTTLPETGETLEVTGLLAVPEGAQGEIPVVSWQHGTILSFDQVPSNLTKLADSAYKLSEDVDSLETLFNVQRFAGNGFAVIAADYVGKGPLRNGRGEAYAVKGATTRTCIDMLNAGLAALGDLQLKPTKLFLHGWSQGALNTQWLHQALRRDGVEIEATAVASPFNDIDEAWRFWTGNLSFPLPAGTDSYPAIPAWIGFAMILALGSYELNYGIDGLIDAAVQPEYRDMARKYWNDYDASAIDLTTFPSCKELLVPGYFEGYTDDRNNRMLRQMAANVASYWDYDRDIRFHYGLADEAIHPAMVQRALAAGGKRAVGVPIAKANHRATFLAGLYGDETSLAGHDNALSWFKSKL